MPTDRVLDLPPSGAGALRTALGILTDNDVPVDLEVLDALDRRLAELYSAEEVAVLGDDVERPFAISIVEADLVLRALRFTEAMSVTFTWYPMVVDTVRFVGDRVTALWTDREWLAFRDGPYR